MERRLTPRGLDRRRQLMDLAARRFAEKGYHPTSVGEIVTELGAGKGVFYWYFRSKEELMVEILREAHHDLRRRQQQAMGDEPDPVRRIELGIRASMRWFDEERHLSNLFHFAVTEERFAPAVRRNEEVSVDDTARHVKEGIADGRIRDADPQLLAAAVLGVTSHLARTFIWDRGEPADAVADAAVAFCLEGLLAGR